MLEVMVTVETPPAFRSTVTSSTPSRASSSSLTADTQCPQSDSREICFHTFIRCTSGPRAGRHVASVLACDGTSNEIRLAVERGLVTQIKSVWMKIE